VSHETPIERTQRAWIAVPQEHGAAARRGAPRGRARAPGAAARRGASTRPRSSTRTSTRKHEPPQLDEGAPRRRARAPGARAAARRARRATRAVLPRLRVPLTRYFRSRSRNQSKIDRRPCKLVRACRTPSRRRRRRCRRARDAPRRGVASKDDNRTSHLEGKTGHLSGRTSGKCRRRHALCAPRNWALGCLERERAARHSSKRAHYRAEHRGNVGAGTPCAPPEILHEERHRTTCTTMRARHRPTTSAKVRPIGRQRLGGEPANSRHVAERNPMRARFERRRGADVRRAYRKTQATDGPRPTDHPRPKNATTSEGSKQSTVPFILSRIFSESFR
jgi:hypothetical protein